MKTTTTHRSLTGVFIFCVTLLLTAQSLAQTFTTLYSFSASPAGTNADGSFPTAPLICAGNTLYGTSAFGGPISAGTIFCLNTNGSNFTTLYGFTNLQAYAGVPWYGVILSGSTIYGTTIFGGTGGNGTVFALQTNGGGFSILHSFPQLDSVSQSTNIDGAQPYGGLVLSGNVLYGTARIGGSGSGTIFALNLLNTNFSVLYAFSPTNSSGNNADGAHPRVSMILSDATLYGVTTDGGASGHGTVFKINTDGTGFAVLHQFSALVTNSFGQNTNSDGAKSYGPLILSGDTLYGTAMLGGTGGAGTIFQVHTNGTSFSVVHTFPGNGREGAFPVAGLTLSGNAFYGTTSFAGDYSIGDGGTIFRLNTDGTRFVVMHTFSGNSDGSSPAGLVMSGDTLYGTAEEGGVFGNGTVFSISTNFVPPPDQLFGFVSDGDENPVPGVNVYADNGQGTLLTNSTDLVGYYSFGVDDGTWTLSVDCGQLSELGYLCVSNQTVSVCCYSSSEEDFVPQLPLILTSPVVNGTNVQITINGNCDQAITLQYSTNLFEWIDLETTNLPCGPLVINAPMAGSYGFYRVMTPNAGSSP